MLRFINFLLISFLLLVSSTSYARETVHIIYGFGPGDTMVNYARAIAETANTSQNKYTFIVDSKPGAGNAIAANYVLNNQNHILFTSSAFFIRPNFYPNQSYDLNNFKELMPLCLGPLAVSSSKYKNWNELPNDRPVTISVSGLGVTTHLVALQLSNKIPNLQIIPFKSPSESLLSVVSGTTDLGISFINEAEAWTGDSKIKLNILGTTGPKSFNGHTPLSAQGFTKNLSNLDVPHHWVVPKNINKEKFLEWRAILTSAAKHQRVLDVYKLDSCTPIYIKTADLDHWYSKQIDLWKALSATVKLN
jgi:tripartite-type tricarboxylate transporter receptor subunit TctC